MRFDRDGKLVLYHVAGPSGQSYETVFPELVGRWLGLDPARIECRSGDPEGPALIGAAAIGSRTILSQGSLFKKASDEIIVKALALAADAL